MSKVAIVDYGMCNLDSVRRAVEECGATAYVTEDPSDLSTADHIILPGVGAFPDAMHNLKTRRLDVALTDEVIAQGAPLLGLCLGMQMLAEIGREGGDTAGLGWIPGSVERLVPSRSDEQVPHVGWNEVRPRNHHGLLDGIPDSADFYFVHSFHVVCQEPSDVAATTPYCGEFVSAVARPPVFGTQFHPEKSQHLGFQILRNFLRM